MAAYISNNCLNLSFYFQEARPYNHPFIGSLFVNDKEYVKFCQNFDQYIIKEPVFELPRIDSEWAKQNGGPWYNNAEISVPYPVMFLDDVEIHWIHEKNNEELLAKFKNRITRLTPQTKIRFLLTSSDLCNNHSEEEYKKLVQTFCSLPNAYYATKYESDLAIQGKIYLVEEWRQTSEERNDSYIYKYQTLLPRETVLKNWIYSLHNYDAIFITTSMLKPNRFQSFSSDERLQQTLDTVASIKKYVPNSFCLLVEASPLTKQIEELYRQCYDYVLLLGNDPEIEPFINHPLNIGHGEMKLLEKGIDYLQKEVLNKCETTFFFKLGARYVLNANFNINNFQSNKYCFRVHIDDSIKSPVYTTGLFSVPLGAVDSFKQFMISGQNILSQNCHMVEKLYHDGIPKDKIHLVETLGLEGMLSYNKKFFSV